MKRLALFVSTLFITGTLGFSQAFASSVYTTGSTGVDVSYPNCSTAISKASFGIVGVTGGLVYGTNSCLRAEAGHFGNLSLYANTGLNASSSSAYYVQAQ